MNEVIEYHEDHTSGQSDWPMSNCYVDVWMLLLRRWNLDPLAGLGVTAALDYEGDQFTFFKYLHDDLELLYGVTVKELSIWRCLEDQIALQVQLGRSVFVEVDGFYLPDTRATSHRSQHTKTTIVIEAIQPAARNLSYLHNLGCYQLDGDDYAGLFYKANEALPPYVEIAQRRWPGLEASALTDAATRLLRRHVRRRPVQNPICCYRADFRRHMDWLIEQPDTFHPYAFNVFRQLGSNFELLSAHLRWLATRGVRHLHDASVAAAAISADAKVLQFKVARLANRRRFDPCDSLFATLENNYDKLMEVLSSVAD